MVRLASRNREVERVKRRSSGSPLKKKGLRKIRIDDESDRKRRDEQKPEAAIPWLPEKNTHQPFCEFFFVRVISLKRDGIPTDRLLCEMA